MGKMQFREYISWFSDTVTKYLRKGGKEERFILSNGFRGFSSCHLAPFLWACGITSWQKYTAKLLIPWWPGSRESERGKDGDKIHPSRHTLTDLVPPIGPPAKVSTTCHRPIGHESIGGLIHSCSQIPHDPITSQRPHL
jgi:hypothetical protein